jgi:hypothetical protein
MAEKYHDLIEFLRGLENDVQKFYEKGQSAAGTRLRKGLSEVKRRAQDIRNEVQTIKADRKASKGD